MVLDGSTPPRFWIVPDGDSAIGRSATCDLVIADADVSRLHAVVHNTLDGVWLEDADSANGTAVNGAHIVAPRRLSPDDSIRVGTTTILASTRGAEASRQVSPGDANGGTGKPWYVRGKSLIIGAGAIAGSITAVIVLGTTLMPPDVEDFGEISIEDLGDTRLSEFSTDRLGSTVELSPGPTAFGDQPMFALAAATSAPADHSGPTDTSELAPEPEPTDLRSSPTPQPTLVRTPGPGVVPTLPPEDNTSSDDDEDSTDVPAPESVPSIPPDDTLLRDEDKNVTREPVPIVTAEPGEVPTQPATTEETTFLEAMSWVEPVSTTEGSDFMGSTLAVGIAVEGLADEDLIITWYLAGESVPEVWREEKLAYTLHATTDRDRGSVTIWVPDLISPAPYQANVRLAHGDGTTIDERSLVFPAEG
ncbi:hypothetical protein B1729_10335 [Microbacterium sp. B35-04]|nr:hypothetical protein B1729_10335 [Microbacterium sp. B35-04]